MIVTCSACSTRYLVDPRALGATGRKVRCARCAQVWHQAPPADAPLPVDPTPAPEAVFESQHFPPPALREPPPPPRWEYAVSGVLVALVLLIVVGGAIWQRDRVVGLWPSTARIYAAIGLPAATPGGGLDLRVNHTARAVAGGRPELVIDGVIANVSSAARTVPKLEIILRDGTRQALQSQIFTVTHERLLPGVVIPFHAEMPEPAAAATQIAVTFAGD